MRNVVPEMSPGVVAEIDARLETIRRENSVATPLAIESGSRAWGFPSPDSDYDCRFVFVRRGEDYMSPWPKRDVIETPLDAVFDINGWDLAKAIKLMLKGNAVILEWLQSPIVYGGDERFRDDMLALARRHVDSALIAKHYLALGSELWRRHFASNETEGPLKKVFYVLRPAMAIRWMRQHGGSSLPPMHFPTLLEQCDAPVRVKAQIEALLALKAVTRELGNSPLPDSFADFISAEFEAAESAFVFRPRRLDPLAQKDSEEFFRRAVERFGPTA